MENQRQTLRNPQLYLLERDAGAKLKKKRLPLQQQINRRSNNQVKTVIMFFTISEITQQKTWKKINDDGGGKIAFEVCSTLNQRNKKLPPKQEKQKKNPHCK
jgi:hypothetical protein